MPLPMMPMTKIMITLRLSMQIACSTAMPWAMLSSNHTMSTICTSASTGARYFLLARPLPMM